MTPRTIADRLDEAVDHVLRGSGDPVAGDLRPLVEAAALVHAALPPIPAGERFERRLAARLRRPGPVERARQALSGLTRDQLRNPRRLLAAGAVSSAAVTVTALALWRTSRRHGLAPQRQAHR
ncbi:MAG: hypothetical protein ACRDHD_11100 [Candidatus Limnocylindria bacterium]